MTKLKFTALAIVAALGVIWYFEGFPFIYFIITIIAAGLFGLIVVGLTVPLYIHLLVNHPGEDTKSGFHLFTMPEEGKVKQVVRGDVLVRMIMLYSGRRFARLGERSGASYWEIIDKKPGEAEESPLADIHWFLKPWAWYVYMLTGAVYTGIYPFQTVREYRFERIKMHRQEQEPTKPKDATKESDDTLTKGNNVSLVVEEDMSDHFRTRQFLFPFRIVSADTKDKIPVEILGVIKAHVTNPFKTAFGTDRWDHQLVNMTTNAITNYTRTTPIDEILTAKDSDDAKRINEAVTKITEDEDIYGIEIDGVDILDITANVNETDRSALQAEGIARQLGKATVIDGQSRAQSLAAINEVVDKGGNNALEALRIEGLVRAAKEAQGGTVLLGINGPQSMDPITTASLAEIKKLNRRLSQQRGA